MEDAADRLDPDQGAHASPDADAAMDAMAELVLVRDAQGRIVHVNAAFLEAFGGARSDWIGRWFAVAPALDGGAGPRRYDAAMATRSGRRQSGQVNNRFTLASLSRNRRPHWHWM